MEYRFAICSLAVCLLGFGGIIIASIGGEMLPTTLTQEEMRRTPNGTPCTPDVCAQMITEKQKSSEGFKMVMVGVAFLGFALLSLCCGTVSMIMCPRRANRVFALEVEETQPQN